MSSSRATFLDHHTHTSASSTSRTYLKMAVASRVPSKILEIIFVESQRNPYGVLASQSPFHPDKATKALDAYSFVCRCWRPVAQELLFRDVVLTLDGQGTRITEFYTFIQSTPHIAGHIRYLLIRSLSAGLIAGEQISFTSRGRCLWLIMPKAESTMENVRRSS